MHALLDELGLPAYPKTTGNRGLHVYVRLERRWDSYDVRPPRSPWPASSSAAGPTCSPSAWWKEERGERIFVDYNQNAPHKTVFGAWSRAAPRRWPGLDAARGGTSSTTSTPTTSRRRSSPAASPSDGDPWAGMDDAAPVASSRCSSWYDRDLARRAAWTRRGRPSTRRCRTSRPASRPAGRSP